MRSRSPLFAGVLALVLTACSGGGDDPGPFDGTLTMWVDEDRSQAMRTFAEAYARHSHSRIEVVVVEHEELRDSFLSAHAGGLGPDLLAGPHDWTGELVEAGAVAPVDIDPRQDAGLFTPGALEAVTYEGQVHGVPYATENLALIRNTDLVPQEPSSIEELVAEGEELVRSGSAEQVLSVQQGQEGDAYHLHPFFTSAGGYLFGEDTSGDPDPSELGVASPDSVSAFERLAELGEDGSGVLRRSTDADNAADLFVSAAAPFLLTGPWNVPAIQEAGVPYEVGPLPGFEDGGPARSLVGVQTFFVASGAADPDLAEHLATTFLSDPELSVILHEADPRMPALDEALDTVSEWDPDLEGFERAGENGVPMPAIPEMDAVWTPFGQAGADVIGGADPSAALSDAERAIVSQFD